MSFRRWLDSLKRLIATHPEPIRVHVSGDGLISVDGSPVKLESVANELRARSSRRQIWYLRDAPEREPGPELDATIKAVVDAMITTRLPIRLCRNRTELEEAPASISAAPKFDTTTYPLGVAEAGIAEARRLAADPNRERAVYLLAANGSVLALPTLAPGAATPEMIASVERIAPSHTPLTICAVGHAEFVGRKSDAATFAKAVPFGGFLLGFAFIGHRVCVIDGRPPSFEVACRGANMLVIDSTLIPRLPQNWVRIATESMTRAKIFLYQPNGVVQQVVPDEGR